MRSLLCAASVLLLASASVVAREPDAPAPFRPSQVPGTLLDAPVTDWFGVYLFGKKAGYASVAYGPTQRQSVPAVQLTTELHIDAKGLGGNVSLRIVGTEVFAREAPHALLHLKKVEEQNGTAATTVVVREGDTYKATVTQAGQPRTVQTGAIDYRLGDAMGARLWVRSAPKEGASARIQSFDDERLSMTSSTYRVARVATSLAAGVKTTFYELEVREEKSDEVRVERLTADGMWLSIMAGTMVELRREPEQQAKALDKSANVFVLGTSRLNRPLGIEHPSQVVKLTLTVEGNAAQHLNGVTGQKATFHPGRGVTEIVVGTAYRLPAEGDDVADATAATTAYPANVPALQAMAATAVGDAQTPALKIERLVAFVSDYVEDSYEHDAATVMDVVKAKKGDCTEHTALFVTLARAVGIPARDVSGLMYMGDEVGALGGHAWAEVVLDGHWIPVDPTFGEVRADAARIAFRRGLQPQAWSTLAGKTLTVEDVVLRPAAEAPPK